MIKPCRKIEVGQIAAVINDAAAAYSGVIPADYYKDPYMPHAELTAEIAEGVEFFGHYENGELIGVMGIQDRGDVVLVRHAYTRTQWQRKGIGAGLIRHISHGAKKPMLVGMWAAAVWAVQFYEKHGFILVDKQLKNALLDKYWHLPKRRADAIVVLADQRFFNKALYASAKRKKMNGER